MNDENRHPDDDPVLRRLREAASLLLWQLGAVRVRPAEPFRLASGQLSPIYVNCRRAISEPAFMQLFCAAARLLIDRGRLAVDVVAGGETAGIPFAAYLASALGRPMVYVRKQAKGHGLGARLEGHLEPGARVLLVEDLITDGGSKEGFLDAVADAGGAVRDVLVLFDREQGGTELLAGRGADLHALADRTTALAVAEAEGLLGAAERAEVESYFRDPGGWSRARR
jgi:orotate phosphoribosyltransferase